MIFSLNDKILNESKRFGLGSFLKVVPNFSVGSRGRSGKKIRIDQCPIISSLLIVNVMESCDRTSYGRSVDDNTRLFNVFRYVGRTRHQ